MQPFLQPPTVSGHAFFCDTPDHVLQELRTAVGKQGSSINPGEKLSFERHALSPSQESHLRVFREAHAQRIQDLKKKHKPIPVGAEHLLADLDHNPDGRKRFPTTVKWLGSEHMEQFGATGSCGS